MKGIRLGEILVEQGVLSDTQVQHILMVQKSCRRPFGDLAERLFNISPQAIEEAWVAQYLNLSGVADLEQQQVDINCLRLLNRRQAWQFRMLPLHRDGEEVHIATCSEGLVRAVNFANRKLDEPVLLLLAERHQLHEFLMKHYPVPEFIAQFAETM